MLRLLTRIGTALENLFEKGVTETIRLIFHFRSRQVGFKGVFWLFAAVPEPEDPKPD